ALDILDRLGIRQRARVAVGLFAVKGEHRAGRVLVSPYGMPAQIIVELHAQLFLAGGAEVPVKDRPGIGVRIAHPEAAAVGGLACDDPADALSRCHYPVSCSRKAARDICCASGESFWCYSFSHTGRILALGSMPASIIPCPRDSCVCTVGQS